MEYDDARLRRRGIRLGGALVGGLILLSLVLWGLMQDPPAALADPIDPPEGYPKLSTSIKTVTPTLAATGGATLYYTVEIRNTGAYTATNVQFTDAMPPGTTYNGDAQSSSNSTFTFSNGTLGWSGDVGFDETVFINFSVSVAPLLTGKVTNTATISQAMIMEPVTVTAEAVITDHPILTIAKSSEPPKPGANKVMTYTLEVANQGRPAVNLPVQVTDEVPSNTTLHRLGLDGTTSPISDVVTWTRNISLDLGQSTQFTFSVQVQDVPSGTVITNDSYAVSSPATGLTAGEPYTVTIVDPIFLLSKNVWPDPPGSNRELTYTLTLLNKGSLATDLTITDSVPAGTSYVRGGSESGGVVSWALPRLDTDEWAEFTYTVYISDIAGIDIVNDDYMACSSEGVCEPGTVLTSLVHGPTFEASAYLDPIAKKPGGGTGPVTPTLIVRNLGPGNAIDASALLRFGRISVSANDLYAIPPIGTAPPFPDGPECGDKCVSYAWIGSLGVGKTVTFTTLVGQSTIGGAEGTNYTATVIISDSLANTTTVPISATAIGRITHFANLLPRKSAPSYIGAGQLMTYTIVVRNGALSTDDLPWLTDTVPLSTTVVNISHGGTSGTISNAATVSWTLPEMSTGEVLRRYFSVRVDEGLVSGTQIVNRDYRVSWYEPEAGRVFSNTGAPVTTTVKELGLIDSYKEVTPTLAYPGPGNVLTYSVHVVNSSHLSLSGVTVYDTLPWEFSTYQRDAIASAGQIISDIVSVRWSGDVAPFSSELITLTVLVDPDFEGAITNTAVISHPDLTEAVLVDAVAYITDEPVLRISKTATPDPVDLHDELLYTIRVVNFGQQATALYISDTVPVNTSYVPGSATAGGRLLGGAVVWQMPVLEASQRTLLSFRVTVNGGTSIVNDHYGVSSSEGVSAVGPPVVTEVARRYVYLPVVVRKN